MNRWKPFYETCLGKITICEWVAEFEMNLEKTYTTIIKPSKLTYYKIYVTSTKYYRQEKWLISLKDWWRKRNEVNYIKKQVWKNQITSSRKSGTNEFIELVFGQTNKWMTWVADHVIIYRKTKSSLQNSGK